jgi:hypothetical protein
MPYRGGIPALVRRAQRSQRVSIASIKAAPSDVGAPAAVTRPTSAAGDFAAAARSASAAAPAVVPDALPAPVTSTATNGVSALAALLAQGDLAAARAALEQLGVHAAFGDPKAAGDSAPATKPVVADVGSAPAQGAGNSTAKIVDAASVAQPAAIDVHQVLLALATGNAGNLPADVINLYGPGGARYDPAAIMEAYRASALGQAQMAAMAWIGKPA